MPHAMLIDATDLDRWSERRDAQSHLPLIIRRLVRATVPGLQRLQFAAGEGVQLGGWDGIVVTNTGGEHVPAGVSGWELGTNARAKVKADADYEKRTEHPGELDRERTAFVFVTSRRWGPKSDWAKARREEKKWADVRAYDADDLETWLEQAPAVHIWASRLLGKRPDGVIDLEHAWREWSSATRYPLTPELVVAGRNEAATVIRDWLKGEPSLLDLQAESRQEAVAFFAATITQMPEADGEDVRARTIVIESREAWRHLVLADTPLVLIPMFAERELVAEAVTRGHHVLLPLGLNESAGSRQVQLGRPTRGAVREVLAAMQVPEPQLDALVTLGRRSLSALRRRLAVNPAVLIPRWAAVDEARDLLPALLAGRWEESHPEDRKVLSSLAGGRNYEEISARLTRWAHQPDPFIHRLGDTWSVVSPEEAWRLLARYVTPDDLARLEQQIQETFSCLDPQYELEKRQRFAAALYGKVLPHSDALREGLAATLAIMGSLAQECAFADGSDGKEWADRILYKLFDPITIWQGWAALSPLLPALAEAAPDVFLDAAAALVRGHEPMAIAIFEQEDSFFGSSPHTGLLWALELLAWSPEHLARAALLLAAFARLDPGGKLGNRPLQSLRQIFLSWFPCTAAPLEQRLQVIDLIRKREPSVAWDLLKAILPGQNGMARVTATPRFRDWVADPMPKVAPRAIYQCASEVQSRLLIDAGTVPSRWCDLIDMADDLLPEPFEQFLQQLAALRAQLTETGREQMRAALRDILARHAGYPQATWAMPRERLERLKELALEFEPDDLLARHAWLFVPNPPVLLPADMDWRERETTINRLREEAVEAIYQQGGLPLVLELLPRVDDSGSLGVALGQRGVTKADETTLLSLTLGAEDNAYRMLGFGFVHGVSTEDPQWLSKVWETPVVTVGSAELRADLLLCFPFERATWDRVATAGEAVAARYWTQVSFYGRGSLEGIDHSFAANALRAHGRIADAIHFVSMCIHTARAEFAPDEVVGLLEALMTASPAEAARRQDLRHDIPELLDLLEQSGAIGPERMAQLEWFFLPLLKHSRYSPRVLHRVLATEPAFFCELLKCLYKGRNEEPAAASPEEINRAHAADDLLRGWHRIPGADDEGQIDRQQLFDWTRKARQLLEECNRAAIGDQQIGHVLAHSPLGADGAWPHEAVRDLIEELQSKHLDIGIYVGVFNSRGVTSRGLDEGGDQERDIAGRYRAYAEALRNEWPRTARLLARIAETYEREARGEDVSADLQQDLWT